MGTGNGHGHGALHTLERNRFYYGKPMDVRHWTIEQRYGIEARQLLSRLGLGAGVLCGLELAVAEGGGLTIGPGVALDPAGREIVVAGPVCLRDPAQPTDCLGRPDGDPVTDGEVTIALCYHECLTEPAKAIACGCDTVERCEAGLVQERFCVRVDRGVPPPSPFPCGDIYPAPPPEGFDRRHTILDLLGGACPPAGDGCVTLGTIAYKAGADPVVDPFTHRRVVYSNQTLFELILCLAARVDECCREHPTATPPRVLRVAPGDRAVIETSPPAERDRFVARPYIDLTFERDMDPAALAAPDPWLGVFSFVRRADKLMARRVALTLDGSPGPAPGGGQLVTYAFDKKYVKEMRSSRVLVQLRPDDGGGRLLLDTSAPPQLLDGEHHGTGVSASDLDKVWSDVALNAAAKEVDPALWDALVTGSPPPFPSGETHEGGRLDLAFSFRRPPSGQPQLLAVWPPSASFLRPGSPDADEREWQQLFRGGPHMQLTFDDTLDVGALAVLTTADWAGLWWLKPDDAGGFGPVRLLLDFAGTIGTPVLSGPAASQTVALKTDVPFADLLPTAPNHFVLVVRGDRASVDADFASPALSDDEVKDLFDNSAWPAGRAVSGPSSLGEAMADGEAGGTAVTFFDFAIDA